MAEPFSAEWIEGVRAAMADGPGVPGWSVRWHCTILGGPGGERGFSCVLEDGRLLELTEGSADGAEVELSIEHDDAVAIARGELDANVAFMQGRLKPSGDTGAWFRLVSYASSPAAGDLRARVRSAAG